MFAMKQPAQMVARMADAPGHVSGMVMVIRVIVQTDVAETTV
jgi:hypothetical protein